MAQTTPAALAAPAVASSLQSCTGCCRPLIACDARSVAQPSPPGRKRPQPAVMWPASPAGTPVAQRAASICSTMWPCGIGPEPSSRQQQTSQRGAPWPVACWSAVVGNQIGKGNGRTAATVLGAVGGGYRRPRDRKTHPHPDHLPGARAPGRRQQPRLHPLATACRGHPVVLQGKGFRVADEGTMPQAQQPQPAPQYQTVSQPGYVASAAVSGLARVRTRPPPCCRRMRKGARGLNCRSVKSERHFSTGYWVLVAYEPHADTACGICEAAARSGGCSFSWPQAWPG